MEVWKNIVGYEGVYQVSNIGNIKSLKRYVKSRGGSLRQLPEKIVKPLLSGSGYLNVIASKNQKRQTLIVHHIVAEYFIGPRPNGLVIDHIDGNKHNNHADNLRYVSTKINLRKRHDAKLTEEKVTEILALCKNLSQSKIAKMYGISQSMVSKINTRHRWTKDGI